MNLLPPLSLLAEWREGGLSPQEIYRRCEEIDRERRAAKLRKELAACEACKARKKGLCQRHYDRMRARKRRARKRNES